jgi:hypothetical protein
MTIEELHVDFKIKYDKLDSNANPNLTQTPHVDWLLNSAQTRLVKQRITGLNTHLSGFEQSQKRVEDLGSLVIRGQSFLVKTVTANSLYRIDYKDVYTTNPVFYLLRVNADLSDGSCTKISNRGQQVQHDDLNRILDDPFAKPDFSFGDYVYLIGKDPVPINEESRSIYFHTDSFAVTAIRLDYIKKPNRISMGGYNYPYQDASGAFVAAIKTECELPEHMHDELTSEAVKLATEIVQSPSYNSKNMEIQTEE